MSSARAAPALAADSPELSAAHICSACLLGGTGAGLFEGLIAGLPLASTGAAVGLWGAASLSLGGLLTLLLRLSLGPCWSARVVRGARRLQTRVGHPELLAALAALMSAGLLFFALSAPLLIWMIERFHRSDLIAYSFLAAQLLPLALSVLLYRRGARTLAAYFTRAASASAPPSWWQLMHRMGKGAFSLFAAAILMLIWHEWGPLTALDGPLVALIAGACLLALLALQFRRALLRGRALLWGAPLLSMLGGLHSARQPLVTEGYAARQWLIALARISDFDRDGVPALFGRDCAPFDQTRHPNRFDVAGDGIDQDCDGRDGTRRLPLAYSGIPREPFQEPALQVLEGDEGRPQDLLLITIDTLRPDHIGFYGYERETTPELDIFLSRAAVFEWAYAPNSGTGPSLWALMSGRAPFAVPLQRSKHFPPDYGPEIETLAERLGRRGYRREAVLCGRLFQEPELSFLEGFEVKREVCGRRRQGQAQLVTKEALRRYKRLRRGRAPFLLWVHYYDPHLPNPAPLSPPPPLRERSSDATPQHPESERRRRYDSELVRLDRSLKRLLELALFEDSHRWPLVALTADHGEDLGERGGPPHARRLVSLETRVPLALWGSMVLPRRHQTPVSTLDLFPTLLRAAGLSWESPWAKDLTSALRGESPPPARPLYQENLFSRPRRQERALVAWPWHLIYDQTLESWSLYQLAEDPLERHNRWGDPQLAEIRARLRSTLAAYQRLSTLPPWLAR